MGEWSETERKQLIQALRDHGKNWVKLTKAVPSRVKSQVEGYCRVNLMRNWTKNPTLPDADLLPILQGPLTL